MERCCVLPMPSSSSSRETTVEIPESHTFRAVSYPWRLQVGVNALRHLADEVRRTKAQRAFVVCGQTVARCTNLLERIKDQLGTLYAGGFDAMDKDSSWPAVQKGVEAAGASSSAPAWWPSCWQKQATRTPS